VAESDSINLALVAIPPIARYEGGIAYSLVFARTSPQSRLPEAAQATSRTG
jgi:hypothetical protein